MAFTSVNSASALVTAFVKNDMKPKFISCFSINFCLYSDLNDIIADISTSLNVVNIAVSFLTATRRVAIFLLNEDIFLDVCSLPSTFDDACIISKTSFLVILPSSPLPSKSFLFRLFCFIIASAKGVDFAFFLTISF